MPWRREKTAPIPGQAPFQGKGQKTLLACFITVFSIIQLPPMNQKALKILVVFLIAALVSALLLSLTAYINPLIFWGFAAATALFAFIVLPKINK